MPYSIFVARTLPTPSHFLGCSREIIAPLHKNTALPDIRMQCAHGCDTDISGVFIFFELRIDIETTQRQRA